MRSFPAFFLSSLHVSPPFTEYRIELRFPTFFLSEKVRAARRAPQHRRWHRSNPVPPRHGDACVAYQRSPNHDRDALVEPHHKPGFFDHALRKRITQVYSLWNRHPQLRPYGRNRKSRNAIVPPLIASPLVNNILERLLIDKGTQIGSEQIERASTNMW